MNAPLISPLTAPLRAVLALSLLVFASRSLAQTVAPAAEHEADDPVVLSVFEVHTARDTGYAAENTTSGSRLNTKLADTPSPISVMTADFIRDIGATTIEDLAAYSINTEPLFGMAGDVANGNEHSTGRAELRARGLPTTRTVNFFAREGEVDTYNTERVEFARGANALLFGIGKPGGVFNTTTKKPNLRTSDASFTLRAGDWSQLRASADLNLALLRDKLGVRINALDESRESWRPNEGRDAERFAVATRWQINRRLRFDVEFETNRVETQTQRKWPSFDSYTTWHEAGENIDAGGNNAVINAQRTALGIQTQAGLNTTYWVWNDTDNQLVNYSATNAANIQTKSAIVRAPVTPDNPTPGNTPQENPLLLDFDVVPKLVTIGGPGIGNITDQDVLTASLTYEPVRNLFVELAQNRQTFDSTGYDIGNAELRVQWDTSPRTITGAPNPHVGRPFVEALPNKRYQHLISDDSRLTAAYELDLGKFWGRHRLASLLERRDERVDAYNSVRKLVAPPVPLTALPAAARNAADAGPNSIRYRAYVDLDGPLAEIAVPDIREDSTTAWVPTGNILNTRRVTTSSMAALQSYLWKDRLIGTFGYRKDWVETYDSTTRRTGTNYNFFNNGDLVAYRDPDDREADGITRSTGLVFHITPRLAIFGNTATSFDLPNVTARLANGAPAGNMQSESDDVGLKFNLINNRLYATVTYYETASRNDTGSINVGIVANGTNAIWDALDAAGVLASEGLVRDEVTADFNSYSFDSASDGWEVEVVANLTPNWRLLANFADRTSVRANSGRELFAYFDEWRDLWLAHGELLTEGGTSVTDRLAGIEGDNHTRITVPDNRAALGDPRYSANLRTNYSFPDGLLKGFSIGGGVRWRGETITAYTAAGDALETSGFALYDLNLGYSTDVTIAGKRIPLQFQLNANNLFDDQDILPTRLYDNGSIRTFRLQEPRQIYGTITVRF
jgi:outer membrane receptor protein involved in Fe transport